jgi:hypothetical protein
MELSSQYTNTLSVSGSGRRKTTAYLQRTAETLLSTKKIVMPQQLPDSQEPEQKQTTQIKTQTASQSDAQQQSSMSIENEPVVEDKAGETKDNEIAVAILCNGICLPTLTSILQTNPSHINDRYSIFPAGCIRHNKCQINLSEDAIALGHTSCQTCLNARTHVRKDRDPELFAVLDNDVQSQIAPSKLRIENALKTKYLECKGFADDSEVSWLCRMMHLSHPGVSSFVLVEETKTRLFFCQQIDMNKDCKFFWVASGKCKGNFCPSCQSLERNSAKRQKRREIDKGDRTSIDSKVNIGALSPQSMKERLQNIIKDRKQLRRKNV